jgi:hypothetical protein
VRVSGKQNQNLQLCRGRYMLLGSSLEAALRLDDLRVGDDLSSQLHLKPLKLLPLMHDALQALLDDVLAEAPASVDGDRAVIIQSSTPVLVHGSVLGLPHLAMLPGIVGAIGAERGVGDGAPLLARRRGVHPCARGPFPPQAGSGSGRRGVLGFWGSLSLPRTRGVGVEAGSDVALTAVKLERERGGGGGGGGGDG